MIFESNSALRSLLTLGQANPQFLEAKQFVFSDADFDDAVNEVGKQHEHLDEAGARARAAYRLLTKGQASGIVAMPIPRFWTQERIWFWVRVAWGIAVLAALILIAARPAHGNAIPPQQPSGLIVQFKNGGVLLATRPAGLIVFDCGANMTCSFSGTTFSLTAGAGGAVAWSGISAPIANLSLAHLGWTTTFTWNAATGAGVDLFTLTDTLNNTGTGHMFVVNLASGSGMKPVQFSINGNGVEMSNAGVLAAIGTGKITPTPGGTTTQVQWNNAGVQAGTAGITYNSTWQMLASQGFLLTSSVLIQNPPAGTFVTSLDSGSNQLWCTTDAGANCMFNVPRAAAGSDWGSALLPWKDIYLAGASGTPGTNNFKLTGTSTLGTDIFNIVDAANSYSAVNKSCTNQVFSAFSTAGIFTCHTVDLTLDVSGVLPLANGGTNAATAAAARTSIGTGTIWSNSPQALIATGVTTYTTPSGNTNFNTAEQNREAIVTRDATLRNLWMFTTTAQGANGALVCTVRVNEVTNSPIVITIAAGTAAGTFSDTTHTQAVSAGNRIALRCVNSSTGNSATVQLVGLEVE